MPENTAAPELLIAGLGNPGSEYEFTPHNLGFLVVGELARRHGFRVTRKQNMSLVGLGAIAGKQVVLAKPQTFMNLCGPAVKGLLERYGLGPERLIAVYDELDLPWGALRIRTSGSSAGHNGVKSLIEGLRTQQFCRLRIGIHPGHPVGDGAKFVLAPFRRAQKQDVEEAVSRSADAVESIVAEGAGMAMTKYNRRAPGLQTEEE
jgi:PTH1 family peptidyl-tRNA hydrolase